MTTRFYYFTFMVPYRTHVKTGTDIYPDIEGDLTYRAPDGTQRKSNPSLRSRMDRKIMKDRILKEYSRQRNENEALLKLLLF